MKPLALAARAKPYSQQQQLLFCFALPLSSASFRLRWPCEGRTFAFSTFFSSRFSSAASFYHLHQAVSLLKWLFKLALVLGYYLNCLTMCMNKLLSLGSDGLLQNNSDFPNRLRC